MSEDTDERVIDCRDNKPEEETATPPSSLKLGPAMIYRLSHMLANPTFPEAVNG